MVCEQPPEDDSEDEKAAEASTKSQDHGLPRRGIHRQLKSHQPPIDYWLSKGQVWPQLEQLAFNMYSVASMSYEPERLFSEVGDILAPKRRQMT